MTTTWSVNVRANEPPTVTIYMLQDEPPSATQIDEAVEHLAGDMSLDGYLAGYMIDWGYSTEVTKVEYGRAE